MMRTTAKHPDITPIPVQLSAREFNEFIFPHLSMPKRGPPCKLGYHRLLNLILWVLYTGMPWKCLPLPKDVHGKPAIHSTTVYRAVAKGSDDDSLQQAFMAAWLISQRRSHSTSVCSMATGPTPSPKKGGWHWLLWRPTSEGREGYRHDRQPWLYHLSMPSGSRP
jgi:transposase